VSCAVLPFDGEPGLLFVQQDHRVGPGVAAVAAHGDDAGLPARPGDGAAAFVVALRVRVVLLAGGDGVPRFAGEVS